MTIKLEQPKRPKAEGYGASMNKRWYRLAAGPEAALQIATRDSLADRIDQKASAFENVLDVGYSFSRNNLTGGEGLDWYPRVSQTGQVRDIDAIRFWDSSNIIIQRPDRGQQYQMRLALDTRVFWTPAEPLQDMSVSSDFIYVGHGTIVSWFSGWDDNTPDASFDFTPANVTKVEAVASGEVFVLTDDGHLWYKPFDSNLFVEVYDLTEPDPDNIPLTNIWNVKDRILAERVDLSSLDGIVSLVEGGVVNTGNPGNPVWGINFTQLDNSGGRWRHVLDAGVAILAACGDGSIRSYVPETDTAGSVPVLTPKGTYPTPEGEEPFVMGFVAGVVLFLTIQDIEGLATRTVRAYRAEVQSGQFDYTLGATQLLRTWVDTTEDISITKRMPVSRDLVFWSMEESGFIDNVWHFDAISGGVQRRSVLENDITAGVLFNSVFAAITTTGDPANDVIVTDPTKFVESGYLISPNVNFGLNTPINWMSVVVEGQNLKDGGDQIELYYSVDPEAINDPDDPTWVLATAVTNPQQSGLEVPLAGIQSKSIALQVKMFSTTSNTRAPLVTRFAVRGYPSHRDFIVDLPINVSDTVSAPGRMPYKIPGLGDVIHTQVLGLSGQNVNLEVLDPPITLWGVVDQIAEPVEYISDRGSVGRFCQVRVRGTRTSGTGSIATSIGLGISKLGVTVLGVGKPVVEDI